MYGWIAMAKRREPAPSTMQSWWHKAVFAQKGDRCLWPDCHESAVDAHHYVHKRYGMLKYDVDNGVPLCRLHHNEADREYGREILRAFVRVSYFVDMQKRYRCVKDYLVEKGISRAEFLQTTLETLKEIVHEFDSA